MQDAHAFLTSLTVVLAGWSSGPTSRSRSWPTPTGKRGHRPDAGPSEFARTHRAHRPGSRGYPQSDRSGEGCPRCM